MAGMDDTLHIHADGKAHTPSPFLAALVSEDGSHPGKKPICPLCNALPRTDTRGDARRKYLHVTLGPCSKADVHTRHSRTSTQAPACTGTRLPTDPAPADVFRNKTPQWARGMCRQTRSSPLQTPQGAALHGCATPQSPSTSSCGHRSPLGTRRTCNTDAALIQGR